MQTSDESGESPPVAGRAGDRHGRARRARSGDRADDEDRRLRLSVHRSGARVDLGRDRVPDFGGGARRGHRSVDTRATRRARTRHALPGRRRARHGRPACRHGGRGACDGGCFQVPAAGTSLDRRRLSAVRFCAGTGQGCRDRAQRRDAGGGDDRDAASGRECGADRSSPRHRCLAHGHQRSCAWRWAFPASSNTSAW